jgi:Metal-dependent hydrolase
MKNFIYCLLLTAFCAPILSAQNSASVDVMTFNVRYDNPDDGDNHWPKRKDFVANMIKYHNPDLIGTQEVLHNQLLDMHKRLPEYEYIGIGREDGITKGEYSAILYKKCKFDVIDSGTFWLGEDITAVGKMGWDAVCERIATWAVFKDKDSGKEFFMINTHFDHVGKVARRESALLILAKTNELSNGRPVVVTGDFNASPTDEPIMILTDANDGRRLIDSRTTADFVYGPEGTFHAFGRVPFEKRERIDYIFVNGGAKALSNVVITDTHEQLFSSDHHPIISTITF